LALSKVQAVDVFWCVVRYTPKFFPTYEETRFNALISDEHYYLVEMTDGDTPNSVFVGTARVDACAAANSINKNAEDLTVSV
jgi:hypothetical protein